MIYGDISIGYNAEMQLVPSKNLNYPVLVRTVIKGENDTEIDHLMGSGAFINFNDRVYFITAKHVLLNEGNKLDFNDISLLYYGEGNPNSSELQIELASLLKDNKIIVHPTADVAGFLIGIKNKDNKNRLDFTVPAKTINGTLVTISAEMTAIKKYNDVLVSNDVFLLGYPSSLKTDQLDLLHPLLRKGIISGKNELKKTIIIDAPVYQGNSGGPVFELEWFHTETNGVGIGNSMKFIGLAIQMVPFFEITETKSLHYKYSYKNISHENSGYSIVVPVDFILEMLQTDID